MNYLDFNSRDTYLAMQKQWSQDFQTAVTAVRKAKISLKEAHRSNSISAIWNAYTELRKTREYTEKLQQTRYDMRAEANRQWLASRK